MSEVTRLAKGVARRLRALPATAISAIECGSIIAESLFARRSQRLIIVDDFFPSLATAFRIAEINNILERFNTAAVYSTNPNKEVFPAYAARFPRLANRVRPFHPSRRLNGSAVYVIFLNNIHAYLDYIEDASLPFAVELYPGGGFYLDDSESDAHLRRAVDSKLFQKVIVTQNVTRDYLLKKGFCGKEKIEFIFGMVALSDVLNGSGPSRFRYGVNKGTVDVCFIANKYMPCGLDKGYDRFIASARILSRRYPEARFHVVGNFTEQDCEVGDLRGRIVFYGHRPTSFFSAFHSRMDLIVSPNVPFVFAPGAFDGFPTGCCIEAALCGTAIFATDELGMNEGRFKDGQEIVIISREPDEIAEAVGKYIADPERLASVAQNGQKAVRRLFSLQTQMTPRLRVLSELISGSSCLGP